MIYDAVAFQWYFVIVFGSFSNVDWKIDKNHKPTEFMFVVNQSVFDALFQ